MLKVDPHTVLNWAKAGIIPEAFRVGRTVRFSRDAVNASLDLNNAGEGRYVEMTSLALKCMLGIDYARMPNMRRHHLCADAARPRLPVCGDGLEFAQGVRLGAFQHHGNRPVSGSFGKRPGQHRPRSGDFQYRSGLPVHLG